MVHVYNTKVTWQGERRGFLQCGNGHQTAFAATPEFKGDVGKLSPEDAFIASLNMGFMVTFLAFAEKRRIPLKAYEADANGILGRKKGNECIIRVIIHPKVSVQRGTSLDVVEEVLETSRKHAILLNSIDSTLVVEHKVEFVD